jgi:Uncharacterized protein conserved in bacteria
MTDKTKMVMLLDFYGDVLTEKQREAMDMYYNDDYSLAEIAENTGISRQGVRDRLQKSEHIINELEEKLHLFDRFGEMKSDVTKIIGRLEKLRKLAPAEIGAVIDIARSLLDK